MEEQAALEAASRRRIANVSRSLADARSAADDDVVRVQAARLEHAFDLALRFTLGEGEPKLGRKAIPRPRKALPRR
ncbi:hypothetical protein [Amycolatopsis lexingtonensis]|uniref:Uncharacterized protein n=1 Tax=Amycolatopsis lexingtonensis TaxID=218822 RepID=A0ABR9I099_9PSEU|nr:hypothetical protein [Amycolatopsis lexingtonensis]MBE1496600.1 hypothetical protein [Amycolatopsis lexingtonensis]